MPSFYSIIQYVPNPLSDERINVGVIAFDGERVVSRTLQNWRRVSHFAGRPTDDVQAFLTDLLGQQPSPDEIRLAADTWTDSVQLTVPRGSLADVDRLLDQMSGIALTDPERRVRDSGKLKVVRAGRLALDRAVANHFAATSVEVSSKVPVRGRHVEHDADLAVRNGSVLLVAQAISFSTTQTRQIERDVAAMAWFLEDIGRGAVKPQMAVLINPPQEQADPEYRRGLDLFRELNAAVVPRPRIDTWAERAVSELVDAQK